MLQSVLLSYTKLTITKSNTMQRIPSVYFQESPIHGRGIFTYDSIPKGSLIEICPVLVLPPEQISDIENTLLYHYYFTWGDHQKSAAILLGFGSLYNHAVLCNAEYIMDYEQQTMDVYALRDILAEEEITFNYNGELGSKKAISELSDN